MPTLVYTQDDFSGGINLLAQDTKLAPNEYRVGFNLRTRFGWAEPVKTPVETMDGLPAEFVGIQGLYAFGSLLVAFIDGLAYYKLSTSDTWEQIADFEMDADVSRIYAVAVPAASMQYLRKNVTTNLPSSGITLDADTNPTPVALVVQDGINQPWLILPDGTAREAQTYAEWDEAAEREYVPIGRQMVFFNGILFIVSADGKYIYRSVSGRPLDFVVAIDNNGAAVADAGSTSFAVDSNEIKLLAQLNTDALIVITAYAAYAVGLNFDSTIYGEPTFDQSFLFTAGVTGQFCFADILGDFAFIDKEGLKSFNAVSQLRFEGNNGVFSLQVAKMFQGIIQTDPCVGSFDNYTFFGVRTSYGPGSILVYDNIKKVFVSVDLLFAGNAKQFASTYTDSVQRFYVATTRNKIYELYSPDAETYETPTMFLRGFDGGNTDLGSLPKVADVKSERLRFLIEGTAEAGTLYVSELVDDRVVAPQLEKTIPAYTQIGVLYPVPGPCIAEVRQNIANLALQTVGRMGEKLTFATLWTGGGKLTKFQLEVNSAQTPSSAAQQSNIYTS